MADSQFMILLFVESLLNSRQKMPIAVWNFPCVSIDGKLVRYPMVAPVVEIVAPSVQNSVTEPCVAMPSLLY